MKTHTEIIEQIKCRLLVGEPFFGYLMSSINILPDDEVAKFKIYGKIIYYNISYIEKTNILVTTNQLLHCIMHIAFCHFVRRKTRNIKTWNKSTDIAVNNILKYENYKNIDGISDSNYTGKSAEFIYEGIKGDDKYDEGFDIHIDTNDPQGEEEVLRTVIEAHSIAKMAGKLPGGFDYFVKNLLEPKLNWKNFLRKYATECFTNEDYSFTNPRKCLLPLGIYCASLLDDADILRSLVIAVDTSGSITDKIIDDFFGEIRALHYLSEKTTILTADTKIHDIYTVNIFEKLPKMKFKGRGGCYDEQTEVLTEDGWKFFKDIKENEIVATLNSKTNKLEYQQITDITNKSYNGKMIKILSNGFGSSRVDLLVTPEHRMFIEKGKRHKNKWEKVFADELPEIFKLKRIANWSGKLVKYFTLPDFTRVWKRNMDSIPRKRFHKGKVIDMNSWLEFFGLYIAEGSVTQDKYVQIPQVKNIADVKRILDKLPFEYKFISKGKHTVFNIYSTCLAMYLKQFGKCNSKFVPKFIKELSSEQINIFLKGYTIGDGHTPKQGGRQWGTVSKILADDILELLLKTNSSGSIKKLDRGNNRQRIYRINEYKKKSFTLRKSKYVKEEEYNGRVYCVTVPNHILYVRRNGSPVWCGNTDFRPVFNYINDKKMNPTLLIYLTDLEGSYPEVEPNYPVLWCLTEKVKDIPFGTSVVMEDI